MRVSRIFSLFPSSDSYVSGDISIRPPVIPGPVNPGQTQCPWDSICWSSRILCTLCYDINKKALRSPQVEVCLHSFFVEYLTTDPRFNPYLSPFLSYFCFLFLILNSIKRQIASFFNFIKVYLVSHENTDFDQFSVFS